MPKSNFERMIELAEEAFDARNDPDQLDVDQNVIAHLQKLHPATVSEFADENGPAVWILLIPTTKELMKKFLDKKISEHQLYEQTPLNAKYEAIYLCSAMVLREFRGKGIAKKLTLGAIEQIRKDHPVKSLFVWAFSPEGEGLAKTIAKKIGLPLLERK